MLWLKWEDVNWAEHRDSPAKNYYPGWIETLAKDMPEPAKHKRN